MSQRQPDTSEERGARSEERGARSAVIEPSVIHRTRTEHIEVQENTIMQQRNNMSDRTNTNGENNNVSWDSHLVAVLTYDRNSSASGVNRTNGQTDEMADGKAHGTVMYADGSVYTGMLEEGNKPGDFGTVTYVGGSAYTGEL